MLECFVKIQLLHNIYWLLDMNKQKSRFNQSCKLVSVWSRTQPEPQTINPNPAQAWHSFWKHDLDPNTKFTEWAKARATSGYWWCSKLNN